MASRNENIVWSMGLDPRNFTNANEKAADTFIAEWRKATDLVEGQLNGLRHEMGRSTRSGVELSRKNLSLWTGIWNNAIHEIINIVKQGFSEINRFIKDSLNEALDVETSRQFFTAFLGDADLAVVAVEELQKASKELGINLLELAPALAPTAQSLEDFARVGELGAALLTRVPGQSEEDFTRAFSELIEGQTISAQRRLNLNPSLFRDLDRLQEEFGQTEGAIMTLEMAAQETLGDNWRDLLDTPQREIEKLRITFKQFEADVGEPILDSLMMDLDTLNDFLNENEEQLGETARLLGELVVLLKDLVFDQFEETDTTIEKINNGLRDLNIFLDTIGAGIAAINDLFKLPVEIVADLVFGVGEVEVGWENVAVVVSKVSGFVRGLTASTREFVSLLDDVARGDLTLSEADARADAVGFQVYNDVVSQTAERIERLNRETESYNDTAIEAIDNILGQGSALDGLEDSAAEAAEAQDKINKATRDLGIKFLDEQVDLAIKQDRELAKFERTSRDKREKELRNHYARLEKIQRDYEFNVRKADIDLQDDLEDIRIDQGREEIEIEKERALKLLEVERDLQERLREIRERFARDQQEAIRKRDAIRFLQLERDKQFALEQAKQDAGTSREDVERESRERREELKQQLQFEIEDARRANERKLRDLQMNLQQQLAEEKIRHKKAIDELAKAEEIKRRELAISHKQQEEDLRRSYDRRLRDLKRSLDEELRIVQAHNARMIQAQAAALQKFMEIRSRFRFGGGGDDEDDDRPEPIRELGHTPDGGAPTPIGDSSGTSSNEPVDFTNAPPQTRQFGGPVNPGRIYRVNERVSRGEFAVFGNNGYMIPSRSGLSIKPQPHTVRNTRIHNDNRQDFGGLTGFLTPGNLRIMQNMFREMQIRSLENYGTE